MMGLLMPVAGMIKVRYRGAKADIDSPCGKLHYRATATVCFMATLLVTANDFWGKTIDCLSAGIPGNVLNTYCWILSTFSVPCKSDLANIWIVISVTSLIHTIKYKHRC